MPAVAKPPPKPGLQVTNSAPQLVTRGISIKEPWAWAIVSGPDPTAGKGWKPIENRTWPTNFRGTVAVQASTARNAFTPENIGYIFAAAPDVIPDIWDDERISEKNQLAHFGCIVGVVDIVGCVEFSPGSGARDFGEVCRAAGYGGWLEKYRNHSPDYWADGEFCFLLDNARQFTQPIPAKGKLNIYHLSPEEIAAVAKALKAPLGHPFVYRHKLSEQAAAAKSKAVAARKTA